jgi:hypothetical protein
MATHNVAINITDSVDGKIAVKIQEIGSAARVSTTGLRGLQTAIDQVSGSGLTGLKTTLQQISASSQQLATTTTRMGQAAFSASSGVDKLATSYRNLNIAASAAILTLQQLATAANNGSTATANLGKQTAVASAGTQSMGGANLMAASTLSVLEGRTLGSNRAVARLLVSYAGLGSIIKAAFPVIGAIALIGILDMMYDKVQKIVQAYKDLTSQEREANLANIKSGEQTLKIKPSGDFNATAAKLLVGDLTSEQEIQIQNVAYAIKRIQYEKDLAEAVAQNNEKGLQGLALAQQKTKDDQLKLDAIKKAKGELEGLRKTYEDILTSTVTLPGAAYGSTGFEQPIDDVKVKLVNDKGEVEKLTAQFTTATNAIQEIQHEADITAVHIKGDFQSEPLAGMKDEIKAAAKEMAAFNAELTKTKNIDIKAGLTPIQQQQHQYQQLEQFKTQTKYPTENLPKIDKAEEATGVGGIQKNNELITQRNTILAAASEHYRDEVSNIGLYNNALKIESDYEKILLELSKNKASLSPQQLADEKAKLAAIKDSIQTSVEAGRYQGELNKLYEDSAGPLLNYRAAQAANVTLFANGDISVQKFIEHIRLGGKIYADATNPLAEYTHSLQNEIDLLGKYGTALAVASEIQKIQNILREKGKTLTDSEVSNLRQYLTTLELNKQLNQEINNIYQQQAGLLQNLYVKQAALLSQKVKDKAAIAQNTIEIAKQNLQMNREVTLGNMLKGSMSQIMSGYKGLATGITDTMGKAFDTLGSGFADSLGRAIAYGQDLGDALKDVARQGLSEIISGLVKLGIQWVISETIAKGLQAAGLAASKALAAATAVAWAPAAALVDTATMGGAGVAADIALTTTAGVAMGIAGAGAGGMHLATGGSVWGTPGVDRIPAMLTNGEFVVKANAASSHRSLLESINNGTYYNSGGVVNNKNNHYAKGGSVNNISDLSRSFEAVNHYEHGGIIGGSASSLYSSMGAVNHYNSGGVVNHYVNGGSVSNTYSGGGRPIKVSVIHDGSTAIQVQQVDDDHIRVIAKREAKLAVHEHAPNVMASEFHNPNSKPSKAIARNFQAPRRRSN